MRVPLGAAHLPADRIGAAREHASAAARRRAVRRGGAALAAGHRGRRPLPPRPIAGGARGATGAHVAARGARVLLADDNADMRDYVRRLLGAALGRSSAVADGDGGAGRRPRASRPTWS